MSIRSWRRALVAGALCVMAGAWTAAPAAPLRARPPAQTPTDRVIVKWRESGFAAVQISGAAARTARLSEFTGVPLTHVREIHDRLDVVRLDAPLSGGALRRVVARLQADPAVQYAEPDERRYVLAFPADPLASVEQALVTRSIPSDGLVQVEHRSCHGSPRRQFGNARFGWRRRIADLEQRFGRRFVLLVFFHVLGTQRGQNLNFLWPGLAL